ncbi:hypothetical protein LWI29_004632 [Acer saccharum]|uniref:Reverse transcriptase domain-containing protein n=1 Tax=Acer saccharum TaxID=4024 RepID=A0AA39VJR9_ACESA|nr:hypothetical protein LWI29_004632 [Acer saccharum]
MFASLSTQTKRLVPLASTLIFSRKHGDIVGEDVINAIQEFFRSGLLFKELNATIISLVPKVPNPSKMKDFRPISCCNTLYKIIAKIIANRIKPCLLDIINPSQSAFVAGRSIGDNILLTQELMRNYHKDVGCPKLALKFTKSTTQSLTTQSASSSSPITIDSQTFERINKSVNSKFSQSHIIDKLRKLRAKYRKQARTRSLIKTSHNQEIFNIAHKMWGRKMKPKEKKVKDPISSDDNNFNEKAEVEEEEEAMVTGNG